MNNRFFFLASFLLFFCLTTFSQEVITLTEPFNGSGGVTLDAEGNIFVADFGETLGNANGTKVYRVYRNGTIEEFADGLEGASGNDFNSEGYLLQSNIAGGYVSKISPDGKVEQFASEQIFAPVGVVVNSGDTAFVADCGANQFAMITPDGQSSFFRSHPEFACPNGLTMDDDGNLYTCNFRNGKVLKITKDKIVSTVATIPSDRCGHLTYSNGFLYVVGRCSNQIYRVSLEGDVQLIAGSGGRGNDDGQALEATFNLPNGIAASADGDTLFINDAVSLDGDCTSTPLNPVVLRIITGINSITDVDEGIYEKLPNELVLEQNYPNPFNPTTRINYSVPEAGSVKLKVFDIKGEEIATLVDDQKSAGTYTTFWSGRDSEGNSLASGVYIYTLTSGSFSTSKKMTLLK